MKTLRERLKVLKNKYKIKGDRAYSEGIQMSAAKCLGEEYKLKKGIFTRDDLDAHREMARKDAWHRALLSVVTDLHEVLEEKEKEKP